MEISISYKRRSIPEVKIFKRTKFGGSSPKIVGVMAVFHFFPIGYYKKIAITSTIYGAGSPNFVGGLILTSGNDLFWFRVDILFFTPPPLLRGIDSPCIGA